jgi:hypothetical protein
MNNIGIPYSLLWQALVVFGGFGATIVALRVTVKFLKGEFEELKKETQRDITGIQIELQKIGQILITQADIRGEIKVIFTRLDAVETAIRDVKLRREAEHRLPRA